MPLLEEGDECIAADAQPLEIQLNSVEMLGMLHILKRYLHLYVATYGAMVNTKRVTPHLIRRMSIGTLSVHTGYT
jgi:hypothetical protein